MIKNLFHNLIEKTKQKIIEFDKQGRKWIGVDGLLNMETSALLTIFLMIFFKPILSVIVSFILVFAKCFFDKTRGSKKEKHDLLCAAIGVIVGCLLAIGV